MNCASYIGWDRDFVSDAEREGWRPVWEQEIGCTDAAPWVAPEPRGASNGGGNRERLIRYLNLGPITDYLLLEEERTTATAELSRSPKSTPDFSRLAALARGARGPLVLTLSPERRGTAR